MPIPAHLTLNIPDTDLPRIVIVGGGFAGLNLANGLKGIRAQVVLLDRNNFHTFQPLLYQVATSGLEPDSIAEPLRKSFEKVPDFYFRMVKVTGVHTDKKEVVTRVGTLSYDYLILANGSRTNFFGNKELEENTLPLKRVVHALNLRSQLLQNFEQAVMTKDQEKLRKMMNIVVVGGGPTGVEVSGAIAELRKHVLPKDYPDLDFSQMQIYLIEGSDRLLNGMSDASGSDALRYVEKLGVKVMLNTFVKDYREQVVYLSDETIESATVIWSAGVMGNIIDGIEETSIFRSRIKVDLQNKIEGYDSEFAIGDLAYMEEADYPNGHPMVAQVAIQQGKLLAKNLKSMVSGGKLKSFKYFDKGSMATIGKNKAVVDLPNKLHFKGLFAWLIWMFIHILYLIGFRNKLVTLTNWIWSYITYDKGTRLIIRTYYGPKSKKEKLTVVQ